ncbi:CcdB family protein [Allosphingosinicella vermicomposti]|uniref:CcdB family protein n=1 Tax=Allosphingosinicella vermicomposti TaxID=614671 RepID=UPI000D10CD14|nr:CcdB family protein [Allosphingosinicella vermicomposti]
MARYDVHRRASGEGYLLDCQADLLDSLNTRFVVPLLPRDAAPRPAGRLNPLFEIAGISHVMVTQYAAAVELRELGEKVVSLAEHGHEIQNALDLLLTGV